VISFDSYYNDHGHLTSAEREVVNYDHPNSLDGDRLAADLSELRAGNDVAIPVYDFATHTRRPELHPVKAAEIIVVEGILLFAFEPVWRQLDFRVFRRCPETVRFRRRMKRDQTERGRSQASIEAQLQATVKPMHDRFVEPHAERADIVTEHGGDLDEIADWVVDRLTKIVGAPRAH